MSDPKRITPAESDADEPGDVDALIYMFASSPVLLLALFLFLLALAIPVKIFSPRTRIFR